MDNMVKLIAINTGSAEIVLERHELPADKPDVIKDMILTSLNKMGKSSHVLIKWKDKLYTAHHMAQRGKSKDYFHSEVKYHPYAKELV